MYYMEKKPNHMIVTSKTRLCSIRIPHELFDQIPKGSGPTKFILQAMREKLGVTEDA